MKSKIPFSFLIYEQRARLFHQVSRHACITPTLEAYFNERKGRRANLDQEGNKSGQGTSHDGRARDSGGNSSTRGGAGAGATASATGGS